MQQVAVHQCWSASVQMVTRLQRHWIPQPPPNVPDASGRLRVMQYNLLADGLAQNGDFVNVKPEVLHWDYRKPLIIAEIDDAEADILCFQELNHFGEIEQELCQRGYTGVFFQKQYSPAVKYGNAADGVAIFWRIQRFKACEQVPPQGFYFNSPQLGGPCGQGALQVVLRELGGRQRPLLVATTHLKAKEGPALDEVRKNQMEQLLASLQHIRDTVPRGVHAPHVVHDHTNGSCTGRAHQLECIPVLIAGDFNTVPNSVPCKLLESHPWNFTSMWDAALHIDTTTNGMSSGDGKPVDTRTQQGQGNMQGQSTLQLGSDTTPSHQPEFSTWKFRTCGERKRIIDYIWHTAGCGLKLVRRWRMLTEHEIGPAGLPSATYPSDHIALCAEYHWE